MLEVGLGGRLDATNVVRHPAATAITPISLDHQAFLGETIAAIAGEKAGIMKPGAPAMVGPQPPAAAAVFAGRAAAIAAPLYRLAPSGRFEADGAGMRYEGRRWHSTCRCRRSPARIRSSIPATALACLEQLAGFSLSRESIAAGLQHSNGRRGCSA